ncbi:hypothetical protein GH714_014307 [Hevea brasiliensis]|uniref:Uncharacterized protein n=1 Tax=Hevea brasiliensis TaxID=3981 RepID=A0A6A6LKM6_HEVBR|nr:hypothetical protein GH714_014307 [Hevea brasiliensis]
MFDGTLFPATSPVTRNPRSGLFLIVSGNMPVWIAGNQLENFPGKSRGWEAFDPVRKKWMALPKIPCDECFNHADKESLAVDSELLVFGRMNRPRCLFDQSTVSLTCGEEYDFETRKWRTIEGMYPNVNRAAQAPPLVAVVDNQLYAVEYLTNMVKKYDKVKNTWVVLGRLPVRRILQMVGAWLSRLVGRKF